MRLRCCMYTECSTEPRVPVTSNAAVQLAEVNSCIRQRTGRDYSLGTRASVERRHITWRYAAPGGRLALAICFSTSSSTYRTTMRAGPSLGRELELLFKRLEYSQVLAKPCVPDRHSWAFSFHAAASSSLGFLCPAHHAALTVLAEDPLPKTRARGHSVLWAYSPPK